MLYEGLSLSQHVHSSSLELDCVHLIHPALKLLLGICQTASPLHFSKLLVQQPLFDSSSLRWSLIRLNERQVNRRTILRGCTMRMEVELLRISWWVRVQHVLTILNAHALSACSASMLIEHRKAAHDLAANIYACSCMLASSAAHCAEISMRKPHGGYRG